MGISLADVGRSGAVPDLLNRLRQSRQDVASGKLAEATEIRAQAGEERAQGRFESDIETAGINREGLEQQRNINALKLKEAEETRARDTKVRKFSEVEQSDPFAAEMMRNSGYVETVNGEEIVTGRSARLFYNDIGKTPGFKKGQIRSKRDNAERNAQAVEQQLAQLKPTDKTRPELEQQLGQLKQTAETYHEMEVAMFKGDETLAERFTKESLIKYDKSGEISDLDPLESASVTAAKIKADAKTGKAAGPRKAADRSLTNKKIRAVHGSFINEATGDFDPLPKDKESTIVAQNASVDRLMRDEGMSEDQAIAETLKTEGFAIRDIDSGLAKVAEEVPPTPAAAQPAAAPAPRGPRTVTGTDKRTGKPVTMQINPDGSMSPVKTTKAAPKKAPAKKAVAKPAAKPKRVKDRKVVGKITDLSKKIRKLERELKSKDLSREEKFAFVKDKISPLKKEREVLRNKGGR